MQNKRVGATGKEEGEEANPSVTRAKTRPNHAEGGDVHPVGFDRGCVDHESTSHLVLAIRCTEHANTAYAPSQPTFA